MKKIKGSKEMKPWGVFYANGRYLLNTYATKAEAIKQSERQLSIFEHGRILIKKLRGPKRPPQLKRLPR